MFRIPSLIAFGLAIALFASTSTQQAEAGHWHHGGYYASAYNSAYFHDYYNYGGRYNHRPYGSYYGYSGISPYSHGWTGYYGGWNTYAPYAYTPSLYASSYYGYYPASTRYVGYPTSTHYVGYGSNYATYAGASYVSPVGYGGCSSYAAPAYTSSAVVGNYAPTCCSGTVAYGPGAFCGGIQKRHCGLLGPLCPFKRWGASFGTCGSYGYGGAYGW